LFYAQVEVSRVPEALGHGHHITIVRDITAVREMEAAKTRAEREALANKVKTETMQTLNHELRTPLQVCTLFFRTAGVYTFFRTASVYLFPVLLVIDTSI
jgi:signal transduction histidine kinase